MGVERRIDVDIRVPTMIISRKATAEFALMVNRLDPNTLKVDGKVQSMKSSCQSAASFIVSQMVLTSGISHKRCHANIHRTPCKNCQNLSIMPDSPRDLPSRQHSSDALRDLSKSINHAMTPHETCLRSRLGSPRRRAPTPKLFGRDRIGETSPEIA